MPSTIPPRTDIERLIQRIVDLPELDRTTTHILKSYLARDRSNTLRDIAAARLRALAPALVYGADATTDAAGWGLLLVVHSTPEPSESLELILAWADEAVEDPAPTIIMPWSWPADALI